MNFILVLSANCYKRAKHGLTVSPPKKTLQGKRHSPVSDPKLTEIKTAFSNLSEASAGNALHASIKQPRAGLCW